MKYKHKAHKTVYGGVIFRSRLEATWAAFFDLIGWRWDYEPIDLDGWVPDFEICFPCTHSECHGHHRLLAEVKPYTSLSEFGTHQAWYFMDNFTPSSGPLSAYDSVAFLGSTPDVAATGIMAHGAGGGYFPLHWWFFSQVNRIDIWGDWERQHVYARSRWEPIWRAAKNETQWKGRK